MPAKRHPEWILWKRFWKFEKMKCICWVVGGNYKSCENPQIRKWVFYCGQRRLKWEAGMKGEEGPTKISEKYFQIPKSFIFKMRCKLFSIEAWPFEFYILSWCFHAMKERVTPITDVLRWTLDEMRSLMSPLVHFIQLTLAMSVSTRNFTAFSFSRGVQFDSSKASTQSRGIYNLVFQWTSF